jgi:Tfp pilus assembly protein PilX
MNNFRRKQGGVTLVVALVMLVLITLLVVTGMNIGKSSLQSVGNMQQRNEVYSAAQETVEMALSSTRFFDMPTNVLANPCNGVPNTQCMDMNGDGTTDVTVTLTPAPTCVAVKAIKNSNLNMSKEDDSGCAVGQQQNFGNVGAATNNSMCADSTWEIYAQAADAVTDAQVSVTQGLAVRVSSDDMLTSCP